MTEQPLKWRTVVVTRAHDQQGSLVSRLAVLGATVVELPATVVVDRVEGMATLTALLADGAVSFAWIVVTSPNGATRLARALAGRAVRPAHIAAVGPGSADALAAAGLPCDLVPLEAVAESLIEAFPPAGDAVGAVLVVKAEAARPVLVEGLAAKGWSVTPVVAHAAEPAPFEATVAASLAGADAVLFAAGSAVRAVVGAYGVVGLPAVVVCMGPVTAEVARQVGLAVTAVADPHTLDGLVAATVASLAPPA